MVDNTDIERAGIAWAYIDNYKSTLRDNDIVVVNTDRGNGGGVHWITIARLNDGNEYVYDPLGPNNYRADSNGLPVDNEIRNARIFSGKTQIKSTSQCGFFAIYVAKLIDSIPFEKRSKRAIDTAITKVFGRTADWGDVAKLHEYFE